MLQDGIEKIEPLIVTSYLPMYLSSSVSASPMNSNLKSLREWANFLWAAERSARKKKAQVEG